MEGSAAQAVAVAKKTVTRARAQRTRPHEVPSTVPIEIRKDIARAPRCGRSFRQIAKDANVAQYVVAQLNDERIEARLDNLADEVHELRRLILRRAA